VTYYTGHVKRDPVSGAVAIRTIQPEDPDVITPQAWLLATTNLGAHTKSTTDVDEWEDLHIAPAPEPAAEEATK
jgi:hypothetical protein